MVHFVFLLVPDYANINGFLEPVQDRCERTESRNLSLRNVNEGFEHRPSVTGSGSRS